VAFERWIDGDDAPPLTTVIEQSLQALRAVVGATA
jgi:hypothetical protein